MKNKVIEHKKMEIDLLQNVPISWIFGHDDLGHIVSVQVTTYNEKTKMYVPVGMIERNDNVTIEDIQTLIDFFNENGDVPVPMTEPRSVIGVEYTSLVNSGGYTDKYLVWYFVSQNAINNTTHVNQWIRIVAHDYYAVDVTANLGFYWLQGNNWFDYGNMTIRVAKNNSSYPSYPNSMNLGAYRSDITHKEDGTFYRTSAVRCSSSGNTSIFPTFTTWDIGITFPNIDRTAPTLTVTFVSSTHDSLTFDVKANVDCDSFCYQIDGKGEWIYPTGGLTANTNKRVTISGLSENTQYSIQFSAKKTVNQIWGYSSSQVQTTIVDQAKMSIKVDGRWITGKVFVKKDGVWRKAKKVFVKKDNLWKSTN